MEAEQHDLSSYNVLGQSGKRGFVYRKHWNLIRKPFTTAYDSELIYFREPFAEAYHTLTLAAHLSPAKLQVLGGKGVGKTTLLRKFEETLGDEMRIIMLAGKFLNERSTLLEVLEKKGVIITGTSSLSLEDRLNEHFSNNDGSNKSAVIVVDDVDAISDHKMLSDLDRLQELGIANDWPLVSLFSGQTIPQELQYGNATRQTSVTLPAPTRNECGEILEHRLTACGSTATIFTPSAIERLITRAKGDVYTLLTMAELCLQIGSVAKVQTIDDELVRTKVEPFLERFFREGAKVRESASDHVEHIGEYPQESDKVVNKTLVATTPGGAVETSSDSRTQRSVSTPGSTSPMRLSPHRLVSQAELESYRASSVSEQQRNNIERLTRKIARGELNLTESIKSAEDKSSEETMSAESSDLIDKPKTVDELNYDELYDAGVETLKQILDGLRKKQFTDLAPVENLAKAVIKSINDSPALLRAAIDQEDSSELQTHLMNVGVLSSVVAKELKLAEDRHPELVKIAMVHDVGHLHCGEELLLSENRFDRKDFKAIKQHPIVGQNLIKKYTNGSELMADVIAQEHERDDGLGYPNYLDSSGIHLYAKIIGVCDVFEALSHSRAHRRALTPEEAIVNMNATMVRRTDPRIVRALHRAVLLAISS